MDTFLNDFRMRTEIKERCGIRIAKTDQSHNKPYINLVAKIEGYLYNVYCLAANMNVSEINVKRFLSIGLEQHCKAQTGTL
jgi:hypothetical protein